MTASKPKSSLRVIRKKDGHNTADSASSAPISTYHLPVEEDTPQVVSTYHPPVEEDSPQVVSTYHPPVEDYTSSEEVEDTPEISLCDKVFLIVGSFLLYLALLSFIIGVVRYLLKIENAFSSFGPLAFILFVIGMALINATATSNAIINLANGSNNSTCCTYDASDSSDSVH
ncbi:MAG: hypothetical protein HFJ87_09295 [Muribaculaceae bacterium]|nr:hypothetical protein [Muribaculaceae bacterium]